MTASPPSAPLPRVYWTLLAGIFVNRLGGFVVPLLYLYLTSVRGLSPVVAGRIAALHGLGSMLGTLGGGVLTDRLGRRATMLLALVSGAGVMLGFGAARTLASLSIGAFLLGLTADAFRPASHAIVADLVPAEQRLRAFSMQYWCVNLAFSCSALVGGAMATRNFATLFVADALTTLVLAVVVAVGVPETRPTNAPPSRSASGSFATPLFDPRFAPFVFLSFVGALIFFQHQTALAQDMRDKGLSPSDYGFAIAANGFGIVVMQPLVTRFLPRFSVPSLLAIASVVTGLGFGLTTFATTLPGYVVTVTLWTLGEAIFAPTNSTVVASLSPANMRGRYQAAFGMSWSFAAFVSPATMPALMTAVGMRPFWALCALVAGSAALLYLSVTRRALRDA